MTAAEHVDLTAEDMDGLLARIKSRDLREADYETMEALLNTLSLLKEKYEKGRLHVKRLLKMIFGSKSEKKSKVVAEGDQEEKSGGDEREEVADTDPDESGNRDKPKGHGRNGADDFEGAQKHFVKNDDMKPGDPCPDCSG